ncbi:uncharacterized protein [Magallana gigas]|uniref:uncharacterized protein n=1 Tax=Magallana gigas TaxID=29159 RepID=UPI003341E9CF
MFNIVLGRCISTVIFIWATRINRVANDDTGGCTYNTFKDGDECKDCPAGYFGHNCSDMCTEPSYGIQCGQKCNCSACHHIFGCNLTTEIPEIRTSTVKHKQSNELQSAENTTHQRLQDISKKGGISVSQTSHDIVENTTYTSKEKIEVTTQIAITPEKIIIILIGSFICLVLMFEIRRETYLYMEVISETSCA